MSELIAKPIEKSILYNGGKIKNNTTAESLIEKNGEIIGVKTKNKKYYSKNIILATDIGNTKKIIQNINHPFIKKILDIKTISVITVHIELNKPMMKIDRTTFTPNLNLIASFSEESRTTFKKSYGRLSIILKSTEYITNLDDENIIKEIINFLIFFTTSERTSSFTINVWPLEFE